MSVPAGTQAQTTPVPNPREAARGGCLVEGYVQTPEGAQRAIDAGIHIIARG